MNRPKIIINAAMSIDGKIALSGGKRIRISDTEDFMRVHHMRNEVDAVLVGINTILNDNPKLTVKEKFVPNPKNPIRVVLDSKLRIPENARVLNSLAPTIIASTINAEPRDLKAKIIRCGRGKVDLHCLMQKLYTMGIRSIMVEGGGTVISAFVHERLVDDFYVFIGPLIIGGTAPALVGGHGAREHNEVVRLNIKSCERLGQGILIRYGVRDD